MCVGCGCCVCVGCGCCVCVKGTDEQGQVE